MEVFARRNPENPELVKVTEARLTYVAIDEFQAKRHIAAAVRATESQRLEGRRLFVTPAYFGPEDLGPPEPYEHIVAIVPSKERWRAQIEEREGFVDERHAREHAQWVARFGTGARAATAGGVE